MFTHDWFGDNGKRWIKWLDKFKGKPNLNFLEIGCFEGRATVWLLEHILTDESSEITVIDTFNGSQEHEKRMLDLKDMYKNFVSNVEPWMGRVIVRVGMSQLHLRGMATNFYDFVYIDGSHEAPDVMEDTILSWRLLRNGGILIWDDYSWGKEYELLKRPRIAIDSFLEIYKGQYKVIAKERQVCIEKI
jgi:predicted O-methyltransferase YrrM